MREYILDGRKMTDAFSAHAHMAAVFGFPERCGRDLDALWDLLCELPVPFALHVTHWAVAEAGLEDYGDQLMELLGDLAEEEPQFSFDVTD